MPSNVPRRGAPVLLSLVMLFASPFAGAALLQLSPYLSAADSPFAGVSFNYFHLENFESGALAVPGVSASGGIVAGPGSLTDSADADDGAVDGSGAAGHSWFSGGTTNVFVFTFNALALGGLPTHAGVVWTDVGITDGATGVGQVQFEAFDALGNSLGAVGPTTVGDGSAAGGTAEDRFFGVIFEGGISKIALASLNSKDWEIDHLQYGRAIPLAMSGILPLLSLALGGLLGIHFSEYRDRRHPAKTMVVRFSPSRRFLGGTADVLRSLVGGKRYAWPGLLAASRRLAAS